MGQDETAKTMDRRRALQLIGGALGAAVLAGCGGSNGSAATTTGTTGTTGSTGATGTTGGTTAHAVTPEGEIGPYFTDDSATGYNRSNILANVDGSNVQAGVPLTLTLYVYDAENGDAAVSGAQVDIWHCNALGVYSNEAVENTTGQNWLRGYRLTDTTGKVVFTTIIPGWYQGRTTHIHLRVRSQYSEASSTSDGTNTTQVFFPQATLDTLYTSVAPYSTRGKDTTTNASDRVYTTQTHDENELVLSGDATSGYAATFSLYLPITTE